LATPADPDRFNEAVKDFRRRVPMTDPAWRKLEASERRRAFWVATVAQARLVQQALDAVDRAIRDGRTLDNFKAEVGPQLAEAWGRDDPAHLENVFRTNVMSAYNGGRYEILTDPVVMEARPFLRFDAVGDSRTSEICEELDGTVLPADDAFWATHTPPLHHQCRSVLTPLTAEEAADEGIDRAAPAVAPDDGFGQPRTPEPSLEGLDPELVRLLRERLGE
jgi:SPP1 gp7 family putative phage head morphogenesis protein